MKAVTLTNEQIGSFCAALEQLSHGGIAFADALVLMAEDEKDSRCRQLLQRMAKLADDGCALADIMEQTGAFPAYVCTLTRVGERVGKIEQTLASLAAYYENRDRMDRQLHAALLYPAVLLAVLLAVTVALLVWVLPVFNEVYAQLGSSLTGIAGALLTFGGILKRLLPGLCGILGVFMVVVAAAPLRRRLIHVWNRLRGDRGPERKVLSARFVQAFSMAISSGMTAREAAELAAMLSPAQTPAFEKRCNAFVSALEQGQTLSQALFGCGFISAADRRLLDAGMRSGRGEAVLLKLSERLLEEGEEALQRRSARIEPALVAVACVLIGAVVLSVMLPLMHIMNTIG